MQLKVNIKSDEITIVLSGRIDSSIKEQLEDCIESQTGCLSQIYLDMREVEDISSGGLRSLLAFQTMTGINRDISVINVNEKIMEVFEKTGFTDILSLK